MVMDFKQTVVEGAASEYEKVSLPPEYRQLLEGIAAVMYPFLGMSELAVRGFISQAILGWQIKYKKKIGSVLYLSPEEKQKVMRQGMDIMYETISSKVLKKPEDQPKLKKAIDEGLKAYLEKYAKK